MNRNSKHLSPKLLIPRHASQKKNKFPITSHTLVGKGQHTLGAIKIRRLGLQEAAHEGIEERHVQQTHNGETHTGDQGQVVHALLLLFGSLLATVRVAVGVVVTVLLLAVLYK